MLVSQPPNELEFLLYYIVFLDGSIQKWAMQELLPAVLATLRDSEDEVATAVVPFLNSWVARLKATQKRTCGVPTVSFHAVQSFYVCLVMIGLLCKATPMFASVDLQVLLRQRPTP